MQNLRCLSLTLVSLTLLTSCATTPSSNDNTQPREPDYAVDIRWTSYGIPHIKATDWASLGYGFAYATATDGVCVIAKDIAMVNGELSKYLGSAHIDSDVFHKAVITAEKISRFNAEQSERALAFSRGYAAGYNRYLADHGNTLPASCRNQPWVRPITSTDVTRVSIGVGIRYGLGRFQKEIANASPEANPLVSGTQWSLPEGIGSNAVAVGRALTASKRGILLGNPHYPWHGPSRFHLMHMTIPGEVDVMGTSLLNTSRVSIGFNADVAWTHTVSTATRFTLYELELTDSDPLAYHYGDTVRPIEQRDITVEVKDGDVTREEQHTVYFSHFGPIVENEQLPWDGKRAYALRDAVIDNYFTADTYDAMSKARNTQELEEAISLQGIYWVNTIAADRYGNAFYADISGTPNIDAQLLDTCRRPVTALPQSVIVLNGTTSDCEWKTDPRSRVGGALPPAAMPRLRLDSYVTNSNDSYWLSNPDHPLEGYSPIIGNERAARSLRTRAGLSQMRELIALNRPIAPDDIQAMLYNHRNFGAELLLDDVLRTCEGASGLERVCEVLSHWDRTGNIDAVGAHVWREFWNEARNVDNLWTVPFDSNHPVDTPNGINLEDAQVQDAIRAALAQAHAALTEANVALDAPLGKVQYAPRNGRNIPIPGGEGWAGWFSMIVANLAKDKGYSPIVHGNSYIQVISWDKDGNLDPRLMLTYSQSPEPESTHYSDLTELYSAGQWITVPFTDVQIDADPNLRELRLIE